MEILALNSTSAAGHLSKTNNVKQFNRLKETPADTVEISSNPNFKGGATKVVNKEAAKKGTAVLASILGLFGIKKAVDVQAENTPAVDTKYTALKAAYPEAAKLLESFYQVDDPNNFDRSWEIPYYREFVRPFILEVYDINKEQGEKLLNIFYRKDERSSKEIFDDIVSNPTNIDKYYAETVDRLGKNVLQREKERQELLNCEVQVFHQQKALDEAQENYNKAQQNLQEAECKLKLTKKAFDQAMNELKECEAKQNR